MLRRHFTKNANACVEVNEISEILKIKEGFQQGCAMWLLILFAD